VVGSFGKQLASQPQDRSSRNLALSSWANAATARSGPKIATALCAITCCITQLPSLHYASSAVILVS